MKNELHSQEEISKMELYYRRFVRFVEYYIFLCFLIITVFPLLDYSWIPGFIKFTYFTGFPLLLLVVLISFVKEPLLEFLKKRFEPVRDAGDQAKPTRRKR